MPFDPFNAPTTGPRAPLVAPPPPPIIPNANFRIGGGAITGASRSDHQAVAVDAYKAQINLAARDETIAILLGRNRVGAQISRALAYGTHMLVICLWGRGTVAGFDAFTMGDVALPSGCAVTHYDGSQVTADTKLVSAFIDVGIAWTNALTGYAYSVVDLAPRDATGGPVNIAEFHAVIRGWKAYDPRDGAQSYASPATWTYTTNPALLAARVMTDSSAGMGATPDADFWASVTTVANLCDFDIGGGTKRRVLNVVLNRPTEAESLMRVLGDYAGCWIVPEGASFRFIPNAVATAGAGLTNSNMIAGSFRVRGTEATSRPNRVFVRYTEEVASGDWRSVIAPRGVDIPAIPSGEDPRVSVVDMPGIRTYDQARRVATERQNHLYLEDISFEFEMPAAGVALSLGDVRPITYGIFTSKQMRLVGLSQNRIGHWQTKWDEYDPASYDDTIVTAPTYTDTDLADVNTPPTVTGLALSEVVEAPGVGGQPRSSIRATWTQVVYPFLAGYRVYVYDDSGDLLQEGDALGNSWQSTAFVAPQRLTVFVKARSRVAEAAGYDREQITLSGSTTSLTLLGSFPILRAGATLVGFTAYSLYPGDPMLRVTLTTGISVATQYATATIADAVAPDSFLNYGISAATYIDKNSYYVTTDPVDMGAVRTMTVRVNTLSAVPGLLSIQAAPTASGPWTTQETTLAQITGRWIRVRVTVSDMPRSLTLPDGSPVNLAVPGPWLFAQDLGGATLQVFAATVEETGEITTSASGPVTVTLDGTYYAQRDLQVSAIDGSGTVVVTASPPGPSPTAIHTFEINATQAGSRVAAPVRWNFKGAV